jgi:signal transduction histidine kinase
VLLGSFLLSGALSAWIILGRFRALEESQARENLSRLKEALAFKLEQPAYKLPDWANWSEAYGFVRGENPSFVEETLVTETLGLIGIDAMRFFDARSRMVGTLNLPGAGNGFAKALDAVLAKERDLLLGSLEARVPRSGFAREGDILFTYASMPVRRTGGMGAAGGVLLFAKRVGTSFSRDLAMLARLPAEVLPPDAGFAGRNVPTPSTELVPDPQIVWMGGAWARNLDAGEGVLTLAVRDGLGRPVATVSARVVRSVYLEGIVSVGIVLGALALSALVTLVSLNTLLGRLVVARLMRLHAEIAAGARESAVTVSGDDEIAGVAGALRDLLANMRRESDLREESQRAAESRNRLVTLGEMAGGIAHEINNPMTIVAGYARILADSADRGELDPARVSEITREMDAAILRVATITRSMRALVRDGTRDALEPHDVGRVIAETLEAFASKFRDEGVLVETSGLDSGLLVECRVVQIAQVVLNLVSNAVDELRDAPVRNLRVTLAREGNYAVLSIADKGNGVPEAVASRIMEPFFTTKGPGEGTGIGLALAHAIAFDHGGALELVSREGPTVFTLRLLLTQAGELGPVL